MFQNRLVVCIAGILCCALVVPALAVEPTPKTPRPVPGRFLVRLAPGAAAGAFAKSLPSGETIRPLIPAPSLVKSADAARWQDVIVYQSADTAATAATVAARFGDENIVYVEQDHYLEFFEFPADPLVVEQWHLRNTGQPHPAITRFQGANNDSLVYETGKPGVDIGINEYHAVPPAEHTRVVVAIVDSGVDLYHPELRDMLWRNPDEIPLNGVDDDHNGYVDDTLGFDISGDIASVTNPIGDNEPVDSNGHGTHIAGIVAAAVNGSGIAGVAQNVEIMSVKIRPNGTNAVAAEAILYAVHAGASVINVSWGAIFQSGILEEVFQYARQQGVFVAMAAGNTGDNTRFYPAAFDSTFAVAAGNADGYLTYFTTFGAHIDITAPGENILSLRAAGTDLYAAGEEPGVHIYGDDSLYLIADGTSMAAPMVCGAAAILLAVQPSVSLSELEDALQRGARDMLFPFDDGQLYVGRDTLSGWGYLDIDNALARLRRPGVQVMEPVRAGRYTDTLTVLLAAIGGYTGGYELAYRYADDPGEWTFLDSAGVVPTDGRAVRLDATSLQGMLELRITDDAGSEALVPFTFVSENVASLTAPSENDEVSFSTDLVGSVYGPAYDSMKIVAVRSDGRVTELMSSTGEFFDSLMYVWSLSGLDTGSFHIALHGYFSFGEIADTVPVRVLSAYAAGWPVRLGSRASLTPLVADLDNDGAKEVVVAAGNGLHILRADGTPLPGSPFLAGEDVRCMPAAYDVDRDGNLEVIITDSTGMHVFNHDGTYAPGWPRKFYTGTIPYGYGYPVPSITQLGQGEDSAIVLVNKIGQIMAYEFNGDSYFYSLRGVFALFDSRLSDSYGRGGGTSPFVSSADLTGDGLYEVVAHYTSPFPYTGLGLYDARTGQPAFNRTDPIIARFSNVHGSAMGDLNNDGLAEIVIVGENASSMPEIQVKSRGIGTIPGWPKTLPDVDAWIGSYPILADLDLDRRPEILIVFFEFDISYLYIFRADGTAYRQLEGYPAGVAYVDQLTIGTPTVADITGDELPEIIFRTGYILPGTGPERLYVLNNQVEVLPGYPLRTPAQRSEVLSGRFAPLVDDIDGDGLVEMLLLSDNSELLVWDCDAPARFDGRPVKFLQSNTNSNMWLAPDIPTDVDDDPWSLPDHFALSQNYPNPFNPSTTIQFDLPSRQKVRLDVFNLLGQRVVTLIDTELDAGTHLHEFDGSSYASGIYLYRLSASSGNHSSRKMVLVK